ncbi:MAG: hypothetical protein ABR903_00905 [Thermodesulfovibrionales bacterium]|jgi:hypothetical protein
MATTHAEHKTYVIIFALTISFTVGIFLTAALYIQPLEGELTRLGSYAERDFGWNIPQRKLRGDAHMAAEYERETDVLIIGDSFSTNGVWQPFFGHETGLSYTTLNIRKTSIQALIESEQFRQFPPKVMIVESVERELISFFKDMHFECNGRARCVDRIALQKCAGSPRVLYYEETRKTFDLTNINLRYAALVMGSSLMRCFSKIDSGDTRRFTLTNDTLFSNRRSGEILVYEGDMEKLSWRKEDLSRAACAIRGLQEKVQSSGKTLFIFMVVPDKSTAYADYISDPLFRKRENTCQLLADNGINVPRVDLLLKAAIDRGEKDIYIPSGTHWSARGYALAATGIAAAVGDHIVMPPKTPVGMRVSER